MGCEAEPQQIVECTGRILGEQTLLLTTSYEELEHVFGNLHWQLANQASAQKRSIHFAPSQLERRRRQHRAQKLEELMPSYRKIATFEKFLGTAALCEYLCAMVGPILNKENAGKHAAALHLPLLRKQTHLRGDSPGAAAIQGMLFWTRPQSGLLASCLCRWVTQLRRRRAKMARERLADKHFWEHLSVRAVIGWKTCISAEQTAVHKTLCGEASKECSHGQQDQDRSCDGLEEVRLHRHRGVSVASASMLQQSASKPPQRSVCVYPVCPPSLTQPPWSPSGPRISPSCPDKRMPNLERLRKKVTERQQAVLLSRQARHATAEQQSWISASSTFQPGTRSPCKHLSSRQGDSVPAPVAAV
ncbi:hypothetical protein CVIRNUC_007667 [Coccomyxa viridis]|uniref:Uncharacterized protein n=1 Tax=Coccomyxa viridis TaxID=1274662 RepID=A0AAV1IB71_9CHLO|nr:hypothetical protein CVIRNUC_007667 [Coccomyxa viridis]